MRMKLPIKKKYFDRIKSGEKTIELRDAHITFICEETKETLRCDIESAQVLGGYHLLYPDVLEDKLSLVMKIKLSGGK